MGRGAGLSFALKNLGSLTLTDKQVGVLMPGNALMFWNESAGQVILAAIRSTPLGECDGCGCCADPRAKCRVQCASRVDVEARVGGNLR